MFWCSSGYKRGITAHVQKAVHDSGNRVSLADVACRKSLLKTVDGNQYLLLKDNSHISQAVCRGIDIRTEPIAFEMVVDDFDRVQQQFQQIKQFTKLCANKSLVDNKQTSDTGWPVEATRHRDALVALDKRRAGWSYRQIALFLYGEQPVIGDWHNPNQTMKNRLIRSVRRGIRIRDGGYKKLLH